MKILKKIYYIAIFLILNSCGNESNKKENSSSYNSTNSTEINSTEKSAIIKHRDDDNNSFILDRYDKEYNWAKIETEISDIEKSRLVNELKPHFLYFLDSELHKDGFKDKLHFVDINNDNKIDAIFNGWSGGEPDVIRFFTQTNNGFDEWLEVLQNPLEIKIIENRIDEITVIDKGCCDAYQVTISKYKVTDKLNLITQTSYIDWTDLKGTTIKPVKFEIINDTYFIRDEPKIDNITENERFETKGNSIGEFTKGQKGIAYKSRIDSTGRVWWLMESEPLDSLKNSYFYNETKMKSSFIGWISSRFVNIEDNKN